MNGTEAWLARIRGRALPRSHNARTIAALASNPGCARRAIMDAAGVDKQRLAAHAGFPASFGQSRFALTRGNAFEAQVKANGAAELLRLLREHLRLPIPEASYDDLSEVGGNISLELRHVRTRNMLARAARSPNDARPADNARLASDAGTMFDHPLLRLEVGGRYAYLEPDLIAFQIRGQFRVVEIKSFAVIDGRADGDKVAAAAIQSAVYVLALRDALAELGIPPAAVADETILVCPENFSSRPVAASLDVRKQLTVLRRQLSRLDRIDDLLGLLPGDLTFDLDPDGKGVPQRAPADLARAIRQVEARYAPECLNTCEMCFFCREEARGRTAALGRDALDDLGGVEQVATVLRLVRRALETGRPAPGPGQEPGQNLGPGSDMAEAADLLRTAARLRAESLGEAV
ncbi:MAG TPA: hypothetical protein VE733_28575 [Streptosporangiaceae bacterium]|nr:hypothetical protein [Streptosporangiaceae bacterium]